MGGLIRSFWYFLQTFFGIYNVLYYGADPTGTKDSTTAIYNAKQALIANGGGKLVFPKGKYLVSPNSSGAINITNLSNFDIVGNQAQIFNTPIVLNSSNDSSMRLMCLYGCSNFTVTGINFLYQVDWTSSLPTGVNREDQMLYVNSYDGQPLAQNFQIYNNSFTYSGPQLDNTSGNINSRMTALMIGSDTTLPATWMTNNFQVYGNTFNACLGRTIYLLLCHDASVHGNTIKDAGKVVSPDTTTQTYGEAVGIRILSSKNITVTGNVISGYNGPVTTTNQGQFIGVIVGASGDSGSLLAGSEEVIVNGNVINFNNTGGYGYSMHISKNVIFANNEIIGNASYPSNAVTYGIISQAGPVSNVVVRNNMLANLMTYIEMDDVTANYTDVIFKDNEFQIGTTANWATGKAYTSGQYVNSSGNVYVATSSGTSGATAPTGTGTSISDGAITWNFVYTPLIFANVTGKAVVDVNFYTDKGAVATNVGRNAVYYSADNPPTTGGNYVRGDICYNTDYNVGGVFAWVYWYSSGGTNYWLPAVYGINKGSLPSINSSYRNQYIGFWALNTSLNSNGQPFVYNGSAWLNFLGGTANHTQGTAAPTIGTWYAGDICWNTAPTASGNIGWVCVTGGTPGTWKTFGTIGA